MRRTVGRAFNQLVQLNPTWCVTCGKLQFCVRLPVPGSKWDVLNFLSTVRISHSPQTKIKPPSVTRKWKLSVRRLSKNALRLPDTLLPFLAQEAKSGILFFFYFKFIFDLSILGFCAVVFDFYCDANEHVTTGFAYFWTAFEMATFKLLIFFFLFLFAELPTEEGKCRLSRVDTRWTTFDTLTTESCVEKQRNRETNLECIQALLTMTSLIDIGFPRKLHIQKHSTFGLCLDAIINCCRSKFKTGVDSLQTHYVDYDSRQCVCPAITKTERRSTIQFSSSRIILSHRSDGSQTLVWVVKIYLMWSGL